jgi:hypothetical protein
MNSLSKKVVLVCASLMLLVGATFAFPATPALADDPYLALDAPSNGITDKDIALMYQHEIAWLLSQNAVFRDIYQMDSDFQDLLDEQTGKRGADSTYPVKLALGEFEHAVFVAQGVHDQAAKVIGAGFGFDAKGKVTNRQNALQTVTDARYNLRDAHYRLVVAVAAMRHTYADWHKQFTSP